MGIQEDLASILYGGETQKLISAENPYFQAAQIPTAFMQAAQSAPVANSSELWQRSLAASLGGLLSGGLQGFGNNYQTTLTDRFLDVANQVKLGQTPVNPGLSENLFSGAMRQGNLANVFKTLQAQQAAQDVLKAGAIDEMKSGSRVQESLLKIALTADNPKDKAMAMSLLKGMSGAKQGEPIATAVPSSSSNTVEPSVGGFTKAEQDLEATAGFKAAKDAMTSRVKAEQVKTQVSEDWLNKVPVQARTQLISAKGFTTQLMDLADRFDKLQVSNEEKATKSELGKLAPGAAGWAAWQTNKFIGGTEENKLRSLLLTLVPTTARLMGEVGNLAQNEQDRVISATLGNITSEPKDIAGRVRELARLNQNLVLTKAKDWKIGIGGAGGDAIISDLSALAAKPLVATGPTPVVTPVVIPTGVSQADILAELARRGVK
jgi:hypothetical protein